METNGKSRVIMLAVSGLLFGATAFGWWVHESNKGLEPTEVAAINQPVVGASAQQIAAPAAADSTVEAPVIAAAPALPQVYPSTSMEDAVRAARASIKKDPTRPMSWGGGARAEQPEHRVASRHSSRASRDYVPPPPNTRLIDPPPVGDPSGISNIGYPVVAAEPEPKHPSVDDVRLVGVIDGKAIFRVNRRAADKFALPSSFTLGKGESFGNIKLQAVGKDDATVQDGSKVATKSLDPVH